MAVPRRWVGGADVFDATRSVLPPEVRRSQNHLRSDPSSIGSRLLDRSRWSKSVYSSGAQKQLFVDRKNLAHDQDEDHLVDLVSRAKKISRGSQSNLSRFRNGIAICAAADRRKRDGFDFVLGSEAQRVPITVGQRLCFTAVPSRPDRTDGMNDEGCGQIVAARNFCMPGLTTAEAATLFQQLWSGRAMGDPAKIRFGRV